MKLPKRFLKFLESRVAIVIQACYDLKLINNGTKIDRSSDFYKDGLNSYQEKVLEILEMYEEGSL